MSGSASIWPGAQESELESEFEQEFETEGEGEGVLGTIGNVLGGLLGEGETTAESEFEGEGEGILGSIGNVLGGLLGESELEGEFEFEGEFEGEAFSFGSFFKKIAPVLKKVAKVAAPLVGTAILGPAGGALGSLAANALNESEFEGEFETEFEGEAEAVQEIASHPLTEHEALAEMMAEAASQAAGEGEAEAMAGAAVITVLSPRDRRALSQLLPDLLRGTAVLTRILRRHRMTRPAVRAVPTIMRRTVRSLKRHAAAGRPVTRRTAARATAREVRRVLGSPKVMGTSLARNLRTSRVIKRRRRSRRALRAVAG
jgi:hypothetical protein